MYNHIVLVGIAATQKTAAASQPVTKPASKVAVLSQKSQPAAQVVKKATAIAPAQVQKCLHAVQMH